MAVYVTKKMLSKMNKLRYPCYSSIEDEGLASGDHWQNLMMDSSKKTVHLAKDMICRVCGKNGCTPLSDKLDSYDIMSAIRSITNVYIEPDDSLPKYICTGCLESLQYALNFKRTCEMSDKKFKKILNPTGSPTPSYPYSKHDFHLILHDIKQKKLRIEEHKAHEEMRKERMKQKKFPKTKQFKCSPCDLIFSNKEKLASHRRERQCMRRACDVCGQLVLSIAQHMRQIHKQSVLHKCPTCGKEFPILARLKNHMLVHTNTFNFFCDLCPYKCKHKYYLVMHMRTHTGEKPYKCQLCPATFVNPSNLNKHKLTHQAKQFKCMLCDKAFRTNTALREHHEATHMNIKHTCNFCGRDFCYKSDLRKHEIRNHNRIKRDYVGGEPSYKQVERMQKIQESNDAMDKWGTQELVIAQAVPVQATYIDQPKEYISQAKEYIDQPKEYISQAKEYIDQPKEYISQAKEYIDQPKEYITQPKEYITQPKEYITQPKEYIDQPKEYITQPKEYITHPKEYINQPKEYIDQPKEYITQPKEYITQPKEYITNHAIYFPDVTGMMPQQPQMVQQTVVELSLPELTLKKDEVKLYETQQGIGYF